VRSPPVSATMENGVGWLISRTGDAAANAISGCWASWVSPVPGRLLPMFACRPRQDDDRRRDGGEQHRRRATAGRHDPMLRMCLLVQMIQHAT